MPPILQSPVSLFFLIPALTIVTGCTTRMGPNAIRPDRAHYGQSIADSTNQQLLLNLVRLHYRDRPVFQELQSIVSQRALRGDISAEAMIGVDGGGGNESAIGAAVGF